MPTECEFSVGEKCGEASRQATEGHGGAPVNRRTPGTVPKGVGNELAGPLLSPDVHGGAQTSSEGVSASLSSQMKGVLGDRAKHQTGPRKRAEHGKGGFLQEVPQ